MAGATYLAPSPCHRGKKLRPSTLAKNLAFQPMPAQQGSNGEFDRTGIGLGPPAFVQAAVEISEKDLSSW